MATSWPGFSRERLDALLEGMPSRRRALAESILLLLLVFAPGVAEGVAAGPRRLLITAAIGGVLVGASLLLSWPTRARRMVHRTRALLAPVLLVGAVAGVSGVGAAKEPSSPPRLGIQMAEKDGRVEVTQVFPGTPAEQRLVPGDRISSVGGQALDSSRPVADLRERLAVPGRLAPGATPFGVERGAEARTVVIELPAVREGVFTRAAIGWMLVRAIAVIAAALGLLFANGQSLRHIGLARRGARVELALGVPVCVATWVVHIGVSVPMAALVGAFARSEASHRVSLLTGLTSQVSLGEFALSAVLLAAFEEVVFRGFLLPRARHVLGGWGLALALVPLLFGLGHLYEGVLAVGQTAVLGFCFGVAFLWRGRLESAIVAHAAFNTAVFSLILLLERTGLLELVRQMQ